MFHGVFVHEFWFSASSNNKNMVRGTTGNNGLPTHPDSPFAASGAKVGGGVVTGGGAGVGGIRKESSLEETTSGGCKAGLRGLFFRFVKMGWTSL